MATRILLTSVEDPADDGGVLCRHEAAHQVRTVPHGHASDLDVVLDRNAFSGQLAAGRRAADVSAVTPASHVVCRGNVTMAHGDACTISQKVYTW